MAQPGRRGLISWEHSKGLMAPGDASGLLLKKSVFFWDLILHVFERFSGSDDPPMCPNVLFGPSQVTLRYHFLDFIPNSVFHWNHNVLLWFCYIQPCALSSENEKWASSATLHAFYQHNVNKIRRGCTKVAEKIKKTKNYPWGPNERPVNGSFYLFSRGWPLVHHMGTKMSQRCPKGAKRYPKWSQSSLKGPKKYTDTHKTMWEFGGHSVMFFNPFRSGVCTSNKNWDHFLQRGAFL
jgi:hypothetical protein